MELLHARALPLDRLVSALRTVGLIGDPTFRPYEHAQIEPADVDLADVRPLANYVLRRQLKIAEELRGQLTAELNVDP